MYSFTYNEVLLAFEDCVKHKKNSWGAREFCVSKVRNILELTDDINNWSYKIGVSQAFVITDPKVREVFAASFRDRVVHHLVIRELEPYFMDYFIPTTFSYLKGRGVLGGVKKLHELLGERSEDYTIPYYIAKLDFQSFFMSIDKNLLADKLDKFILERYPDNRKKECLLWLCRLIILHCPEENCKKVGDLSKWKKLPKNKSLFNIPKNKGLAIGNLTSQMFANFLLTEFDWFCIFLGLDIVRYADDFVLGCYDLEYLKKCIPVIKQFVEDNLSLTIHPDKLYIQECKKGITFIGSIIKQNRIYCGNRCIWKFKSKIHSKFSEYDQNKKYEFINCTNSYLGLMRHFKSYKIRKKIIKNNIVAWLPYVQVSKNYYKIN